MTPRKSRELPCVLLTGFDPFGGESVNPSWEAVRRLDGAVIHGHRVVALRLPTEFRRSHSALKSALARWRPRLVLCVGQAGGRATISLERVAINLIDARIPDNSGRKPIDVAVVKNAPAAYFSTLPIKALLQALREAQLPAEISNSAGTFVCNAVFFGLMHALAAPASPRRSPTPSAAPRARGGFVHAPFLPAQAAHYPGAPSLAEDEVVRALHLIIDTALRTRRDRRISAGTES
jgi:pyroglutamyl-peptidase